MKEREIIMAGIRAIEFEILKEPWNKYEIQDGSTLKIRTILKKVERIKNENQVKFNIDVHTLTVIHANPKLKGNPNKRSISPAEIQKTIEKRDMRYNTLAQEFNEYQLDDGVKIKIYTNVTNISRSSLKERTGDPLYSVQASNQIDIKPPTNYTDHNK